MSLEANSSEANAQHPEPPPGVVEYVADPAQMLTHYRLLGVLGVLVVVILAQAAFNLLLYWRKPDTLVIERSNGADRVLTLDNRQYGVAGNVSLSPDRLTDGDKKYLAQHFLALYYGHDPDRRGAQLTEAMGLMVAARGREMFTYLKQNRILEQQAAESWQAVWTPQQSTVDATDPFTLRVIGIQQLTRIINQRPVTETHQLQVTLKLAKDELGRADRNQRTGYQIAWFGWEELPPTAGQATSTPSQSRL